MKRAIFTSALAVGTLAFAGLAVAAPATAAAPVTTVYNATEPGAPNLQSVGPEAYAYKEIGDAITLGGSARKLNTVTVTVSSWACQSGGWSTKDCYTAANAKYTVPVTLNIYAAPVTNGDGTVVPGELLTRVTKKFAIPYRPTASIRYCHGDDAGKWYSKVTHECYNGKAVNLTYNFTSLAITLPDTVVVGFSFNTTHYGYHPIGQSAACFGTPEGCFYDSLNVGLGSHVLSPGTKPYPDTAFQNSDFANEYCDQSEPTGVFRLDSPTNACWTDGTNTQAPAIKVTAH